MQEEEWPVRSSLGALTSKRLKVIETIVENRPGVFSTVLLHGAEKTLFQICKKIKCFQYVNNIVLILIDQGLSLIIVQF